MKASDMLSVDIKEPYSPEKQPELIPEKPMPNHPEYKVSVPFWRQEGFRRGLGGAFMLVGGIMSAIPAVTLAGNGIFAFGSFIYGWGMVGAAQKSKPEINNNKGLFAMIVEFLQQLVNVLKKGK
jgi:hypothetical protein